MQLYLDNAAAEVLQAYYEKNGSEYDHSQFSTCEGCGHCCEHEA